MKKPSPPAIPPVNDLKLSQINPVKHAMYSPALYRWLRKQTKRWPLEQFQVYRNRKGVLFIGIMSRYDDSTVKFWGVNLHRVLSYGVGNPVSFTSQSPQEGHGLRLVRNFWDRYRIIGRCAIDVEHRGYFTGRWRSVGKTRRKCLWCGHCQVLHRWTEKIKRAAWVTPLPETRVRKSKA